MGIIITSPPGKAPAYQKVAEITVGAGGAATVTFSGLDLTGDTDDYYFVRGSIVGTGVIGGTCTINGDTTAAHYHQSFIYGTGGAVAIGHNNNATMGLGYDNPAGGNFELSITRSAAGYAQIQAVTSTAGVTGGQIAITSVVKDDATITNITSITFTAAGGNYPENSRFQLYKASKL